jgi:hypothetical protein
MGASASSLARLSLILLAAVATAGLLAYAIWSQLPEDLSVRTDIVGYPTFANFNSERYYHRYWLVAGFVPLVSLGLFLLLDRVVPGRLPSVPNLSATESDRTLSRAARAWAVAGRIALAGAILGLATAVLVRRETDWIWMVGVPVTVLYGAAVASLGRWVTKLPGADVWERTAAANALVAPLVILGVAAVSYATKVVGPEREWAFRWLPIWLALAATLAAVGWSATRLHLGIPPRTVDRGIALVVSAPVALFLSISALPGSLGPMDMFHEGERLAAVELVSDGAFPWRDLIFIHGLLSDVLAPLVGMTVFDDSRWGAFAGESVILVPLYWIVVYAFCAYMFRGNWLFLLASQVAIFATVSGVGESHFEFLFQPHVRFLFVPLALIALVALLRRGTWTRAGLFSGLTLVQTILAPEAAIAGVIFALAVPAYEVVNLRRSPPLLESFRRTALAAATALVQLVVWCAFLAWHGALDAFFATYLTFASDHILTGAFPLSHGIPGYGLAMYVPPTAAVAMLGLVAVGFICRVRISPEDWGAGAMALFVLAYYHKFLARPDAHVFQVAAASVPLVLYVVFRFVGALDQLFMRLRFPNGPLKGMRVSRAASVAALALVAAANATAIARGLEWLPSRSQASTGNAPELNAVGFATKEAVDESLVRDLRQIADFYLEPGDTVFDFSNAPAFFHYLLDLRPATRYYHVSLAIRRETQLDLIKELEQAKPKLVFFTGPLGLPSWDLISNQIRHYEVSEWILDRYRPVGTLHGFLIMIPKSPSSPRITALPRRLSEKLVTDSLYNRTPPCAWGYVPNFLAAGPEAKGMPLVVEKEDDRFTVRGWAVDQYARTAARLVLVARGERVVGFTKPNIPRPDIERFLSDRTYRQSGYEVGVAWNLLAGHSGRADLTNVRVYGLLHDGRAVEAGLGDAAGWKPSSPLPRELRLGGWRIAIATETPQTFVEESSAGSVVVRIPSFARYGWLELEAAEELAANDFTVSPEGRSSDAITFRTLGRGERRIRVRVGSCSQWLGYRGTRLAIRSRVHQDIKAVRVYR